MNEFLRVASSMRDDIEQVFEKLHAVPEGPFAETKTGGVIGARLTGEGFRVRTGLAQTGVVADLGCVGEAGMDQQASPTCPTPATRAALENPIAPANAGTSGNPPGPTLLALRADMDAMLHSVDGKEVHVHSCGHDAHSTMVLAAGVILARECPEARGRLRLVFQPAEETGLGAERMIQAGAVEGVDAMFGIHLRPAAECRLGQATPCLVHAGGSGGKPSGVIPEQGELTVNIRAESDEMADELRVRVDTAVKAAGGLHRPGSGFRAWASSSGRHI